MTRSPLLSLRQALAITCVFAAVIAYGTLYPGAVAPPGAGNDKVQHFIAFAGLAVPISLARPRLAIYTILTALIYGGVIEVIQPFVGRDRSVLDLAADVLGACFGAGLAVGLNRLMQGRARAS